MEQTTMTAGVDKPITQAAGTSTMETAANTSGTSNATAATADNTVTEIGEPETTDTESRSRLKREYNDTEIDDDHAIEASAIKRICTEVEQVSKVYPGPEVFARARMALCETVPYYRAYKSSVYTQKSVIRAFYMDGAARKQDIFKAQVVISCIGGGRALDEGGKRVRVGDMDDSSTQVRAWQKAKAERLIFPIIAGRNHPLWPIEVPHNFNVLDYFQVTDIWAERNAVATNGLASDSDADTITVFCVRLEKVNLEKPSWWDHNPSSYVRAGPVESRVCTSCNIESKTISQAGWTCLNHKCASFYKDSEGKELVQAGYSDAFLQERITTFIGPIPSVIPYADNDKFNGIGAYGYGSEAIYRSGIVCSCGMCVSRVHWNRWSCQNCGKEKHTDMKPYPKALVKAEAELFSKTVARLQKANRITDDNIATKMDQAAVKHQSLKVGLYKAAQFLLPDATGTIIGSVTVLRANDTICERGPDKMFDTLSVSDIGLRRNPVSGGHGANEGLSRHFGINWGAPYKFGVTVDSKGFSDAPETILQAVQQMRWAGATAVPLAAQFIDAQVGPNGANVEAANVNFNECLSLGYMENDMIHYHDDGEKECGPTVATISLGAPAMMSFRPKKKSGMEGVVSVPPKVKGKNFTSVLSFPLFHGDITIMHGSRIHGLYEHEVEPAGGRRFALTCRYMDPTKMKTDAERLQAKIGGELPERAQQYIYHGDGHLINQHPISDQGITVPNTIGQDTVMSSETNVNTSSHTDAKSRHDTEFRSKANSDTTHNSDNNTDDKIESGQTKIDRYFLRVPKNTVNYNDEAAFPAL